VSHPQSIADRAWTLAAKHIPYFDTLYAPARNAILAAITEALKEAPPGTIQVDVLGVTQTILPHEGAAPCATS
jgi:hypothetical protein